MQDGMGGGHVWPCGQIGESGESLQARLPWVGGVGLLGDHWHKQDA